MRPALFLPSDYKKRTRRVVSGVAKTGEVSPKGTVTHIEHWDDRVSVDAGPAGIHYIQDGDGIRPMTFPELVEHGYFIVGRGPIGVGT